MNGDQGSEREGDEGDERGDGDEGDERGDGDDGDMSDAETETSESLEANETEKVGLLS